MFLLSVSVEETFVKNNNNDDDDEYGDGYISSDGSTYRSIYINSHEILFIIKFVGGLHGRSKCH